MGTAVAASERLEDRLRLSPGGLGLIPYLMAGHPDRRTSLETARRVADLGVAALELGVPCARPHLDGPVIAGAGQRALASGTTMAGTLELASQITWGSEVPLILMTYLDPLLAHGVERFADDAADAGVAGVIVADLGSGRCQPVAGRLREKGLHTISVVSSTASDRRVAAACSASSGFVYCALAARTGVRTTPPSDVGALVARVRLHTSLPVVAGFGISRPDHLEGMRNHADAVAVGSALVAALAAGQDAVPLVEELLVACR